MLKRLLTDQEILAVTKERVDAVDKDDEGEFADHFWDVLIYIFFV